MNNSIVQPKSLIGSTLEELESLVLSFAAEKFRALQLFDWIYSKQIDNYDKMSNLPILLRKKL